MTSSEILCIWPVLNKVREKCEEMKDFWQKKSNFRIKKYNLFSFDILIIRFNPGAPSTHKNVRISFIRFFVPLRFRKAGRVLCGGA